ncbi:hypothetical protein [Novosphingobium sp.]|jgi:hypothetical protein|uniref:hypothetical protein n=1 Tax=Novosphingobium sp. TaxID=1874826 RepID=UPI0031D8AC64
MTEICRRDNPQFDKLTIVSRCHKSTAECVRALDIAISSLIQVARMIVSGKVWAEFVGLRQA